MFLQLLALLLLLLPAGLVGKPPSLLLRLQTALPPQRPSTAAFTLVLVVCCVPRALVLVLCPLLGVLLTNLAVFL